MNVFNAWETLPWGWIATGVALVAVVGWMLIPKAMTREAAIGCLAPFAIVIAALVVFVVVASFVATAARNGGKPPDPSLCPVGNTNEGCTNRVALPPIDPAHNDPLPASQRQQLGLRPDGSRILPGESP